jgi:hypothetical protein
VSRGGSGGIGTNRLEKQLTGCEPEGPEGLEEAEAYSSLLQRVHTLEVSLAPGTWEEQLLSPVGGSFHKRPLLSPRDS